MSTVSVGRDNLLSCLQPLRFDPQQLRALPQRRTQAHGQMASSQDMQGLIWLQANSRKRQQLLRADTRAQFIG